MCATLFNSKLRNHHPCKLLTAILLWELDPFQNWNPYKTLKVKTEPTDLLFNSIVNNLGRFLHRVCPGGNILPKAVRNVQGQANQSD